MKRVIYFCQVMIILFCAQSFATDYTEYTETAENPDGSFSHVSYAGRTFFNREGIWERINESVFPCPQGFCSRHYFSNLSFGPDGHMKINRNGETYSLLIDSLLGNPVTITNVTTEYGTVTYELEKGFIWLEYQHLTDLAKETLILNKTLLNNAVWDDLGYFPLRFKRTESSESFIAMAPFMYDDYGNVHDLYFDNRPQTVSIMINGSWIGNPNRSDMIYIDPTVFLNHTNITWDGSTRNFTGANFSPSYIHFDVFKYMEAGLNRVCPSGFCPAGKDTFRAGIDWDIRLTSNISEIVSARMELYVNRNGTRNRVGIYHMQGNDTFYEQIPPDYEHFWQDKGNGTKYARWKVNDTGFYDIDLENATDDIIERNGTNKTFSLGFAWENENQVGLNEYITTRFRSSEANNLNRRPKLNITYLPFVPPPPPTVDENDLEIAKILFLWLLGTLWVVFLGATIKHKRDTGRTPGIFNIYALISGLVLGIYIMSWSAPSGVAIMFSAGGLFMLVNFTPS